MSTVDLIFYRNAARDADGRPIEAPEEPALGFEKLDVSGAADHSAAFPGDASFVLIRVRAACHLWIATADVTGIDSTYPWYGAGATEFRGIRDHPVGVAQELRCSIVQA